MYIQFKSIIHVLVYKLYFLRAHIHMRSYKQLTWMPDTILITWKLQWISIKVKSSILKIVVIKTHAQIHLGRQLHDLSACRLQRLLLLELRNPSKVPNQKTVIQKRFVGQSVETRLCASLAREHCHLIDHEWSRQDLRQVRIPLQCLYWRRVLCKVATHYLASPSVKTLNCWGLFECQQSLQWRVGGCLGWLISQCLNDGLIA